MIYFYNNINTMTVEELFNRQISDLRQQLDTCKSIFDNKVTLLNLDLTGNRINQKQYDTKYKQLEQEYNKQVIKLNKEIQSLCSKLV